MNKDSVDCAGAETDPQTSNRDKVKTATPKEPVKEDKLLSSLKDKYEQMKHFGREVTMIDDPPTKTKWFPYHCLKCDKKYYASEELKRHMAADHKESDPYLCTGCGHTATKKTAVIKHMKLCNKDVVFHCSMCLYSSLDMMVVMRHKMKHATHGLEALKCEECAFTCEKNWSLTAHMRRVHGRGDLSVPAAKEKRFVCQECGYKTSLPHHLKEHKRMHSGEKPFVCEFCGEAFPTKNAVRAHSLKHTGIRDYKCPYCDYTASVKKTLDHHVIRKHEQDKLQRCHLCSHTCPDETQFRRHLRRKHDIECDYQTHLVGLRKSLEARRERATIASQENKSTQ